MGAEALNATRRALFSRHQPEGSGARTVHRNAQQRETALRVFTGVAIFVPACDVLREQVETDGRGGQRGRIPRGREERSDENRIVERRGAGGGEGGVRRPGKGRKWPRERAEVAEKVLSNAVVPPSGQ